MHFIDNPTNQADIMSGFRNTTYKLSRTKKPKDYRKINGKEYILFGVEKTGSSGLKFDINSMKRLKKQGGVKSYRTVKLAGNRTAVYYRSRK